MHYAKPAQSHVTKKNQKKNNNFCITADSIEIQHVTVNDLQKAVSLSHKENSDKRN